MNPDELLTAYEKGQLTRRQYLSALFAVVLSAASTPVLGQQSNAAPLGRRARNINHVGFDVSNVQRTAEFYQKLGLAGTVREIIPGARYEAGVFQGPTAKRYGLDIAPGVLLTMGEVANPGGFGHFCIGIEGFDYHEDAESLRAVGLEVDQNDEAQTAFVVKDPDGRWVQVSDVKETYSCPNTVGHKLC